MSGKRLIVDDNLRIGTLGIKNVVYFFHLIVWASPNILYLFELIFMEIVGIRGTYMVLLFM